MSATSLYQEENSISELNQLLLSHLKEYLGSVEVRFDEPDPEHSPSQPTFHLFMYLIHEALNVRHSNSRQYDATSGTWREDYVSIRCLYLVTYWAPGSYTRGDSSSPGASADNESVMHMSNMIRALLTLRRSSAFKKYQINVIEPEALNSLGNFWQSLGNKPRTIINFAVTMPISLELDEIKAPPIVKFETMMTELSESEENNELLIQEAVRQKLWDVLGGAVAETALRKVAISTEVSDKRKKAADKTINVLLAGITYPEAVKSQIEKEVKSWPGKVIFEIGGASYTAGTVKSELHLPFVPDA